MTLIEALLSLPEHGDPAIAPKEAHRAFETALRFVRRRATLWSLTRDGARFLAQFRPSQSAPISQVVVRLVIERDGPMFQLVCDTGSVRRVRGSELRHSLRTIQAGNPEVKILFDYRRRGRVA